MVRLKRGEVLSDRMSSSKRFRVIRPDRLSTLPDSIIIHILSLLDMNQSAVTTLLSKRWQSVWTESPRLVFHDTETEEEYVRNFVTRVSRTLVICGHNDIDTLSIQFCYEKTFEPDVNAWIDFAIKHEVKRLSLLLMTSLDSDDARGVHTLPQKVFRYSYWEELSLRRCVVAPRRTVEWYALTDLTIERVELQQHVMKRILAGCPVLYRFVLKYCWGFDSLEVESKSLYELQVFEPLDKTFVAPFLHISAPYLHSLWLSVVGVGTRRMALDDISSLTRFTVNFIDSYIELNLKHVAIYDVSDLLQNIVHVKELHLKLGFTEAIRFWLALGEFPRSDRTHLSVEANVAQNSIELILLLLESSPKLETLVIQGAEFSQGTYDPSDSKGVLRCDMLHLKTIIIKDFLDPDILGEKTIHLARILLKHTPALEKMVINIEEAVSSSTFPSGDVAFKMAKTLVGYPRASPKAVVLLS